MNKKEFKQKISSINQKINNANKKADELIEKTDKTIDNMMHLKKELENKEAHKTI